GEGGKPLDLLVEHVVGEPAGRCELVARRRRRLTRFDTLVFDLSHVVSTWSDYPPPDAPPVRCGSTPARRRNSSRFSMIEWFERSRSARISSRGRADERADGRRSSRNGHSRSRIGGGSTPSRYSSAAPCRF